MSDDERTVWKRLVKEANRLGHEGKRVLHCEVYCPETAASGYMPFLLLDNGPRTATEVW